MGWDEEGGRLRGVLISCMVVDVRRGGGGGGAGGMARWPKMCAGLISFSTDFFLSLSFLVSSGSPS